MDRVHTIFTPFDFRHCGSIHLGNYLKISIRTLDNTKKIIQSSVAIVFCSCLIIGFPVSTKFDSWWNHWHVQIPSCIIFKQLDGPKIVTEFVDNIYMRIPLYFLTRSTRRNFIPITNQLILDIFIYVWLDLSILAEYLIEVIWIDIGLKLISFGRRAVEWVQKSFSSNAIPWHFHQTSPWLQTFWTRHTPSHSCMFVNVSPIRNVPYPLPP